MMKLLLKTIIAAETKPPSPPPEEPSPSLVSISKSDVIKHQLNRTPMGEYIVNPGEKPLTSLGNPGPGPANYNPCPNLTKEAAPQYSIVGKPKKKEHGRGLPGPADYGTSGDLIWKKKYAIKGRATCYFDEEASKYCTVIGPAKYNVRNKQFGMEGLKYSMAHKQPGDIITGPPNNIVQPSDTHGYATPGPNYRPNSRYWTRGQKKSMGAAQKKNIRDGPGPADYSVSATYSGPSYSFGVKLPPAPNIQRTIAKETPAPSTYYPTIPERYHKRTTLAYKWFEVEEPVRPGPGDYTLTTANMKKDPAYSVRQQTHPSYPESLNYVPKSQSDVPGPGNYHISRDVMENESPAYSMRQQLKAVENDVPAPNKYEYEKKRIERGSKFSMGKRFTLPNSMKDSPGPGTYSPKQLKCSPKYSMKGRTPIISKSGNTPSPNSYSIPPEIKVDDKKAGVTIKSRASPYVYSGFRSTKLADGFNIAVPLKA
ncbi:sperm-tail PG-rich repeat-containing protein 2-like isoform X6 [Mytilus galloprovincialis]|uniref:sperm-tail PG-rich repeat-containing protein 2-like isoform X6 n=1 Tax=Mytilus galloprovincialis TaxID=29158 RepID=UPI003F7B95B8